MTNYKPTQGKLTGEKARVAVNSLEKKRGLWSTLREGGSLATKEWKMRATNRNTRYTFTKILSLLFICGNNKKEKHVND